MCLVKLTTKRKRKVSYGYKVFTKEKTKHLIFFKRKYVKTLFSTKWMPLNKWINEKSYRTIFEKNIDYIYGRKVTYEKGFHIFEYLKDARIYREKKFEEKIFKVEFRDVVASGLAYTHSNINIGPVFVAKKIKIIKEIK